MANFIVILVLYLTMIPPLDSKGLLPPGKHRCTLLDVEQIFVYNSVRRNIFEGLEALIKILKSVSCGTIYLDGSFVTSKPRPNDVDVCWQEGTGSNYAYEFINAPILNPSPTNRAFHKTHFKADVFPADMIEIGSKKYFLDFFQEDKSTGIQKGILQIDLL